MSALKITEICVLLTFALLAGCGAGVEQTEFMVDRGVLFVDANEPASRRVSGEFRIVNHATSSWDLEVLQKSCGCANLNIPQRHLEPGESTVATVDFLTRCSPERRVEEIVIGTGTDDQPRRLVLVATTIPRISFQPPRPEYRRILDWSGQGKLKINLLVCHPASEPDAPVSVAVDNPNIGIRQGETTTSQKSGVRCSELPVEIYLKPDAAAWKQSQSGILAVTVGKYSRQERVMLQWPEQVRNFPESIFIRSGFSDPQTIDLRFEAKSPFSISCRKSPHDKIKVERLVNDKLINHFRLTVPPRTDLTEIGELSVVEFESSFDEQPLVKVPIHIVDY